MTDKKILELLTDIQRILEDMYGCSARKCAEGISKVIEIKEFVLNGSKNQTD